MSTYIINTNPTTWGAENQADADRCAAIVARRAAELFPDVTFVVGTSANDGMDVIDQAIDTNWPDWVNADW